MPALDNCRTWISRAGHQPLSVRALTVWAGLLTAAAALAIPARADATDDAFLSALDNAGVNYADSGSAATLGQSICPMLAQEGGTFASAASSVAGNTAINPTMADAFATIAIQMYCPSMMTSLENGQMPSLPQIPGLPAGL